MSAPLLILIVVFYLASTLLFVAYLRSLSRAVLGAARVLLGLGFVVHLALLISMFTAKGSFIPDTPSDSHLYLTVLLSLSCLVMSFRKSLYFLIIVLLPVVSLGLAFFHIYSGEDVPLALPSPWIWTHVLLTIAGEAFFCIGAGISVAYLLIEYQLKKRNVAGIFARIPSLPDFERFLHEMLFAGFVLLTLGMALGVVFARQYWNQQWLLDPKVIFCVLTWLFYAVLLLLRRLSPFYRGHRTAVIAVLGFFSILVLSWGIDFFASPSLHVQKIQNSTK